MSGPAFRCAALIAALSVSACAVTPPGPGPAEVAYQGASQQCAAGDKNACAYGQSLYPQVAAEQQAAAVAQNNAAATGAAMGILGAIALISLAILSGGRYHDHGHYGRRW